MKFPRNPGEIRPAYQYLLSALLFCVLVLIISLMKLSQLPKLEEGTFVDNSNGSTLTVRNDAITYGASKAHYDLWIGKGKRFLSTKAILGDLFVIDTHGDKEPAEIILDNVKGARTACSIRDGHSEICFQRVG